MTLNIIIKKLDGHKEKFAVEETATVESVKVDLAEKAGLDFKQLRLIHKGRPMQDAQTIREHNVAQGDTLHLILQLRGGSFVVNTPQPISFCRDCGEILIFHR